MADRRGRRRVRRTRLALVRVADDAGDLPSGFGSSPDVDELERSAIVLPVLDVTEAMAPGFNGSVVLDRVDLERARNEVVRNRGRFRALNAANNALSAEVISSFKLPAIEEPL
jgi:hypothetical protein